MKKLFKANCIICDRKTNRTTTKTCSIKCRGIAQIKNRPKSCLVCNKIFKLHNKNSKYCSIKCQSQAKIGRKFSKEHRKKLSNCAKTRTGKKNPMYGKKAAHGKGTWHITWENEKVWTRSSWEKKYLELLDSQQIKYLVEPKAFDIIYFYNGKEKEGTYRPDVYLIDTNKYIEIKGWWRDDAKDKYEAMILQYPEINIILLQKEDLIKKGLKI